MIHAIYCIHLNFVYPPADPSILVSFEETNYTVNEMQSLVEVCVIVQNNLQNTPISLSVFTISIGSAMGIHIYKTMIYVHICICDIVCTNH